MSHKYISAMEYEVTIGMAVYNVGKYIRMSLDSALAQTFESIEFLILDDCGIDESMEIVREYQLKHPRGKNIRILSQPHNMGIGMARNRIVDEAQGRFLYFMDSDDSITPNAIELLYSKAKQYNAQIVFGSYERVEEYHETVQRVPIQYPSLLFLEKDEFPNWAYCKYGNLNATSCNFLIDVDIYRKNQLRYKDVGYWEDFTFTMDLPTYITRAVLLPDITYFYYCRKGSLSNYQKRTYISKTEIMQTANAIEEIKDNSDRVRQAPYFPSRMLKLMKTDFFIVCTIFRHEKIISPSFTNQELHDMMRSPITIKDILSFRQARLSNLLFYSFWLLPTPISVLSMRFFAKMRKLI